MISMNWVKDYIDIENENLDELADKVTKAGINVEHVISNHIDNLVVGKVLSCVMKIFCVIKSLSLMLMYHF